jgi:hypothetical protein
MLLILNHKNHENIRIKEQLTNLENVTLCYQTEVLFQIFYVTEVGLVTKTLLIVVVK